MEGDKRQTIGGNAYPMVAMNGGHASYTSSDVSIVSAPGTYSIATTQMHATVMGRDSVIKETVIATYLAGRMLSAARLLTILRLHCLFTKT